MEKRWWTKFGKSSTYRTFCMEAAYTLRETRSQLSTDWSKFGRRDFGHNTCRGGIFGLFLPSAYLPLQSEEYEALTPNHAPKLQRSSSTSHETDAWYRSPTFQIVYDQGYARPLMAKGNFESIPQFCRHSQNGAERCEMSRSVTWWWLTTRRKGIVGHAEESFMLIQEEMNEFDESMCGLQWAFINVHCLS